MGKRKARKAEVEARKVLLRKLLVPAATTLFILAKLAIGYRRQRRAATNGDA